jgi:hypothetical protein
MSPLFLALRKKDAGPFAPPSSGSGRIVEATISFVKWKKRLD